METDTIYIIIVILFIVFLIGVGIYLWKTDNLPDWKSTEEEWCAKYGGQYFQGGLFSSDNCVFPPIK